jgi:hypothetical protein
VKLLLLLSTKVSVNFTVKKVQITSWCSVMVIELILISACMKVDLSWLEMQL